VGYADTALIPGRIAVYLANQNAGLLLTRVGTDIRFEAMELLAPDRTVMECTGRLRRCFPSTAGSAAAVPLSTVVSPAFLRPFLTVLDQLDPFHSTYSFYVKTENPQLVTEMVMGVLHGIGRIVTDDVPHLSKHSREEAVQLQHGSSYDLLPNIRRSPLWLLAKVALQLTLDYGPETTDRLYYKAFMVFMLSRVLKAAHAEHASHDILLFMKTKIQHRLVKLGSPDREAWYHVPYEILQSVESTVAGRWAEIQSSSNKTLQLSLLEQLRMDQDTLIDVKKLQEHLEGILTRNTGVNGNDNRTPRIGRFPFYRTRLNSPGQLREAGFHHDRDVALLELADFEKRLQQGHLSFWTWLGDSVMPMQAPGQVEVEDARVGSHNCDMALDVDISLENLKGFAKGIAKEDGWAKTRDNKGAWLRFVDDSLNCTPRAGVRVRLISPQYDEPGETRTRLCATQCSKCIIVCLKGKGFGCENTCDAREVLGYGTDRWLMPVKLGKKAQDCDLCGMLFQALWPKGSPFPVRPVRLYRDGSNLFASGYDRPILRLCGAPGGSGDGQVQVGPRKLLYQLSSTYSDLLRSWIQDCDDNHGNSGCHGSSKIVPLPTRVIDVEERVDSIARLVKVSELPPQDRHGQYIALSHCWGKQSSSYTGDNRAFKSNVERLYRSIDFDQLGKTFQDAITVTKMLGYRYLWIDSLCILQDPDMEDWAREAEHMQDIFSLADCIIAATAAEGANAGFLGPRPSRSVAVVASENEKPLYFCDSVDDFHADVEKAILSTRGWVLQERALARRTIYFTARQTYWECGLGIRCETRAILKK